MSVSISPAVGSSIVLDAGDRLADRVLDAFQLDLVAVDDRVAGTRVAVAIEADAAGVNDLRAVHLKRVGLVRVPREDVIDVQAGDPRGPEGRVGQAYSSIGSRGVAWTSRNRLPPMVNIREVGRSAR